MARYSTSSRYLVGVDLVPYVRYTYHPGKPTQTTLDIVLGRRYTSWVAEEGAWVYNTKEGDALPDLARQFLGDPELWWRIADLNPHIEDLWELPYGTELLIPPV